MGTGHAVSPAPIDRAPQTCACSKVETLSSRYVGQNPNGLTFL
jgi:hypothetical protein